MKKLTQLIDARLVDATLAPIKTAGSSSVMEEVDLQFDRGRLTIHNPCTLRCDTGVTVQFHSIIGNRVTYTDATRDEWVVVFEGRIYLSVSLKEEDFIRPEAAIYYPSSGQPIVCVTTAPE